MRVDELFDDDDAINEAKQRLDPKCWTGYKKAGTKMKGGVRVNNCVPVEEAEIPSVYSKQVPPGMEHRARYKCPNCGIANKVQDWAANDNECPTCLEPLPHGLNQMPLKYQVAEENKGLYYNVNKRKKAGTSRDKDHPKAPTAQAWKDAAKTAKKEDITESNVAQAVMNKINPVKQWLLDLQKKLSTETGETKTMFDTYVRYTQGQASEQEMAAANEQFKDVLRGLGMGTLAAMPGSVVTLPLVFKLAKQFNVQIVPSAFRATAEAVNLDRSKNAQYPNDPATQKHRLDTAKRLLSDPKTDPDSRREAAAIIARMEPKGKA